MEEKTKDEKLKKEEEVVEEVGGGELEKVQKERDEYLEGWKRAKADFLNYQKDERKRLAEAANYSREAVLADLLAVLDSVEMALAAVASSKDDAMKKGVEMIQLQLLDALKRHNLEKIKVSTGDNFDPNFHESIGEQEDKSMEPGKISAVVSSGYTINGKVVRPTRVKLAK